MRGAFGKPQGTVARVHIGQPIMSVRCKDNHKAIAIEALRRAKFKFPGRQKVCYLPYYTLFLGMFLWSLYNVFNIVGVQCLCIVDSLHLSIYCNISSLLNQNKVSEVFVVMWSFLVTMSLYGRTMCS